VAAAEQGPHWLAEQLVAEPHWVAEQEPNPVG